MANKLGWSGAGLGGGGARVSTQARQDLEAELRKGWDANEMATTNRGWTSHGDEEEGSDGEKEGGGRLEQGADDRAIQSTGFKYANEYKSPAGRLDGSVWEAWEEMEGDEDGSGDVAMMIGELAEDKTREDPLGKFMEDSVTGRVLQKTGITPCWCSGYGQNCGPDKDGWCSWEMDVLRRDGNLFVGLLVPSVVEGELDRQWNSKCFRDLSWYWATTAGTLMCGDQITKTLPTNKVPVFHANAGDTVRFDLKVNPRVINAKVISFDSGDLEAFNACRVTMKIMPEGDGRMGAMLESLPALYHDDRCYTPSDYEMLDGTFVINLREEPEVGDVYKMRLTGELLITHWKTNGRGAVTEIGRFKGVPHDASPAACLNSLGDSVRLRGVWGPKDQRLVNELRERMLVVYGRNEGVEKRFAANSDPVRGLSDWILLKALRTQEYDMGLAVQECLKFCKREARPAEERNRLRDIEAIKIVNMTTYTDDYKTPKFKLDSGNKHQDEEDAPWMPRSIPEALDWRPRNHVD